MVLHNMFITRTYAHNKLCIHIMVHIFKNPVLWTCCTEYEYYEVPEPLMHFVRLRSISRMIVHSGMNNPECVASVMYVLRVEILSLQDAG